MTLLKFIAFFSFFLIFYPIFAVPSEIKEWVVAIFNAFVFITSSIMIYLAHKEKIKEKRREIFLKEEEMKTKEEELKNKDTIKIAFDELDNKKET